MKFLLIIAITAITQFASASETFRVAVPFIPKSINPRTSQLNIAQYIDLQIYFPLLEQSDDGTWRSEFLDMQRSKPTDLSFTQYELCLKKNLKFSDGSIATSRDLSSSILKFHSLIEQAPALDSARVLNDVCVQVVLKERSPHYFSSLQGTASTLLKTETEDDLIPIGLGPYFVSSIGTETVEMSAQEGQGNLRFNKLVFDKVRGDSFHPELYQDINPVAQYFKSTELSKFKKLESRTYKTYALVINVEDKNFRNCVASELNASALVESYKLNLSPTVGFLPEGILGSNVKFQKPKDCKLLSNFKSVIMIVPFKDQLQNMNRYKELIFGRMAKFISPTLFEPTKMSEKIFERKPYMSVIAFDTSGTNKAFSSEASVYFESFFRDNRILTKPIAGLSKLIAMASAETKKEFRANLFEKAHRVTLSSGYIFPLGEAIDSKLYSKDLTRIAIADPISGYLQIDKTK